MHYTGHAHARTHAHTVIYIFCRRMYWIESGKIKTANMKGSAVTELTACSSSAAAGLTIGDTDTTETIYWGDGQDEKVRVQTGTALPTNHNPCTAIQIYKCAVSAGAWTKSTVADFTLLGVLTLKDVEPVSLSLYKDSLYFTDKKHDGLVRLSTFILLFDTVEEVLMTDSTPGGLAVYNRNRTSGLSSKSFIKL